MIEFFKYVNNWNNPNYGFRNKAMLGLHDYDASPVSLDYKKTNIQNYLPCNFLRIGMSNPHNYDAP